MEQSPHTEGAPKPAHELLRELEASLGITKEGPTTEIPVVSREIFHQLEYLGLQARVEELRASLAKLQEQAEEPRYADARAQLGNF
jgi:BMFP domain-containing protein YqiC